MSPQRSVVVCNGRVDLAVTDRGGSGPTIVLMPGLGMRQQSLARVATSLPGWRVVTMDLRGHGASTTGPWTFAEAVQDLHDVVSHLELERPYVGGHSLGGMVALRYALSGRPVAGVVNIDGWGPGIADRFVGQDVAEVEAHLTRTAAGDLPRTARVLSALTRQGRQGTSRQVLAELDRTDVVAWHAAAPCPSLALHAVEAGAGAVSRLLGEQMRRLQRAHQEGLSRDLAALAAARSDVMVAEVAATHLVIRTHPQLVADAITSFHERCRG